MRQGHISEVEWQRISDAPRPTGKRRRAWQPCGEQRNANRGSPALPDPERAFALIRGPGSTAQSRPARRPGRRASADWMFAAKGCFRVEGSMTAVCARLPRDSRPPAAVRFHSSFPLVRRPVCVRRYWPSDLPPIYFPNLAPYLHSTSGVKASYHGCGRIGTRFAVT